MSKVTPCLWFAERAEEAAKLYAATIPHSKIHSVLTVPTGPAPGAGTPPKLIEMSIGGMDVQLLEAGPHEPFTQAISLAIECKDQAEVDRCWYGLLEGGGKEEQCGWLRDRYGVSWQVVPRRLMELMKDKDTAKANRVVEAMMKMVKLDIAALERAAAAES